MVWNLFDLSGSFCMFGFYLIMFYSRPLLCTFCSACLCHCRQNNDIKKNKTLHRLSKWHFYPLWFSFDSLLLPTLWHCRATPWGDGASMALAEKLVPRAGIHIYKHAIPLPFRKFYFVQLGKNTNNITTHNSSVPRWKSEEKGWGVGGGALCKVPCYKSAGMIADYWD